MDYATLQQRLSLPLDAKIALSMARIREWRRRWGGVYVSVSGGLDSSALFHMVRKMYPRVDAVWCNTRQEYPEIVKFVRGLENVKEIKPRWTFLQVIRRYGYPFPDKGNAVHVSRARNSNDPEVLRKRLHGEIGRNGRLTPHLAKKWHWLIDAPFKVSAECCRCLKTGPLKKYSRQSGNKAFVAVRTGEAYLRQIAYVNNGGCNAYDKGTPTSSPLAFWTSADVWEYIRRYNVPYCREVYDADKLGMKRSGCMFCLFGVARDESGLLGCNRIQALQQTHPRHYRAAQKLGILAVMAAARNNGKINMKNHPRVLPGLIGINNNGN